jgi:gliding motility-associated-like protein
LPTITGICKGIITLTVTAANGCKTVKSFTITDNPDLQLTLSNIQQPRCNGDCNGAVTLVPSGGTLPYTFTWSPSGNTNPLTALCSNTYIATITDNKGCIKTESVIINNPPLIALTSTVNNSSCSTAADGGASVTVSGGTPAFNFTWTSSATSFTSNSQNITNVLAGTYSLSLIDNGGCVKTTTVQIVPTITISANAGNNATVCPTGSVILTGTNSTGAVSYNWFLLPNTTTTVATTPTIVVPNASGTSTYVLQAISSASTCFDFDTVVVNIFPLPLVDAGPSYTIPVFSTVTIGGSPTSPTGLTFTWSPPFNLDNGNIPNPAASNTVNTSYTVTTTDANGCAASDTMHVFLYPQIMIPNGFSPNGDSKNDKWIIDLIEQFPDNTVEVYNRWGEQLFYSKGYTVPFDGRYKGKDLPVGTYYYIINLNHPAYTTPYTGPLTIFR